MRDFPSKLTSLASKVGAAKDQKAEKGRYMGQEEVKSFYEAVRSDPVLINRFLTVSIGTVHTVADKIFDLLSTTWKQERNEMIMPFFELEIMANIRELEVDALFTHFINEYKGPADNLAVDFWECLKQKNKAVSSTSNDNDNDTNIKNLRRGMLPRIHVLGHAFRQCL